MNKNTASVPEIKDLIQPPLGTGRKWCPYRNTLPKPPQKAANLLPILWGRLVVER